MVRRVAVPLLGMALVTWACADSTGPGNATSQDQQQVQAALDLSGFGGEDFGDLGAVADFAAPPAFDLGIVRSPGTDTVRAPRIWGRRRGRPVAVVRDVVVSGDTARATITRRFEGTFVLRLGTDSTAALTAKPLIESLVQRAVLVRRPADSVTTDSLKWRLVALSPQEYRATRPVNRTVQITHVTVAVNGQVKIDLTDPQALYGVDDQVPRLALGDTVVVTAEVTNTTGGDHFPSTFVFLHVDRADPRGAAWRRERMGQDASGSFVRAWVVRVPGRARFAVDAIDAATFTTASTDDYRANVWGVPFRIE